VEDRWWLRQQRNSKRQRDPMSFHYYGCLHYALSEANQISGKPWE